MPKTDKRYLAVFATKWDGNEAVIPEFQCSGRKRTTGFGLGAELGCGIHYSAATDGIVLSRSGCQSGKLSISLMIAGSTLPQSSPMQRWREDL